MDEQRAHVLVSGRRSEEAVQGASDLVEGGDIDVDAQQADRRVAFSQNDRDRLHASTIPIGLLIGSDQVLIGAEPHVVQLRRVSGRATRHGIGDVGHRLAGQIVHDHFDEGGEQRRDALRHREVRLQRGRPGLMVGKVLHGAR